MSQMCGTGKSSTSDIITLVQTDMGIPPMSAPNVSLCGSLQAFTVSLLKIIYYSQTLNMHKVSESKPFSAGLLMVIVSLGENVTKQNPRLLLVFCFSYSSYIHFPPETFFFFSSAKTIVFRLPQCADRSGYRRSQ